VSRLQQIEDRLSAIKTEIETDGADIDALEIETNNLIAERSKIKEQVEKRNKIMEEINNGSGKVIDDFIPKEGRKKEMTREEILESAEYRSGFFKRLIGKKLTDVEERAFTSATDSAGAAIPTQTANVLFDKMVKIAPMLNEVTLLRVAGNVTFTIENARADAALHTENGEVTPATDSFTSVSLGSYEIIKVLRISKTVQTMTINAFEGWLTKMLAEDIAEKIEDYIINGTGSSQPKGIKYAATYTDGSNAVEYTNASIPTYAEILELISYLASRYDKKAKFLCNKKFLYQYFAAIKDGQNNPILIKDFSANVPFSILGYPVIVSDKVANKECYLGDFTNVVANLAQDVTVEASTQSGFLNNSIDYRGTAMFDCDIALTDSIVKLSEAAAG